MIVKYKIYKCVIGKVYVYPYPSFLSFKKKRKKRNPISVIKSTLIVYVFDGWFSISRERVECV